MIKDAETFSKADKDFTAKHDAKNDLEAYVHSVEETISSPAANLKRPAKIQIEQELTKALELLEVQDASATSTAAPRSASSAPCRRPSVVVKRCACRV